MGSLTKVHADRIDRYMLPMIRGHIARQRHRLSCAEVRAILAERYASVDADLYLAGSLLRVAHLLLRVVALGHSVPANLWYPVTAAPPVKALKRQVRRLDGHAWSTRSDDDRPAALADQGAYRSGMLSLSRSGVRHALTVVMFHRVIDPGDADFAQADPSYTVSALLFEQQLGFFRDHYVVVDIGHVLDAADGVRKLPEHALLITFDDGWADNLHYAAPLLRAHGMPAVIFVAAEAVQADSDAWWQEDVFALGRAGRLDAWLARDRNRERISAATPHGTPLDVVTGLALMASDARASISPRCRATVPRPDDEWGRALQAWRISIAVGLHGDRHVPLTSVTDVAAELTNAHDALARLTEGAAVTTTLGCPHGRYDDRVLSAAQNIGIRLVFTSDKRLNATQQGCWHMGQAMRLDPLPMGRREPRRPPAEEQAEQLAMTQPRAQRGDRGVNQEQNEDPELIGCEPMPAEVRRHVLRELSELASTKPVFEELLQDRPARSRAPYRSDAGKAANSPPARLFPRPAQLRPPPYNLRSGPSGHRG